MTAGVEPASRGTGGEPPPEMLAARSARGDSAAFSTLVRQLSPRLFNFLLRRVGDAHEAEDLTQETFVRAWRAIGTYDPERKFTTWLFTIAIRLAVSTHRTRRRGRMVFAEMDRAEAMNTSTPRGIADSEHLRPGRRLWELAFEVLTDEQHTLLWLRYAEDMPMADIGTVVGKSEVAVRVALFRAREKLALAAEAEGLANTDEDRTPSLGRSGLVGGAP